jgi:hypothetical protein
VACYFQTVEGSFLVGNFQTVEGSFLVGNFQTVEGSFLAAVAGKVGAD